MKLDARSYLTRLLFCLTALTISTSGIAADDWSGLHEKKKTKLGLYMTAQQAYDYTTANMDKTLFLDIRTPSELNYLGAATVMDAHVPFVLMDISGWDDKKHRYKRADNKNFVADVEARLKKKGLTKEDTVILMCRSGKRSASAVNKLADAGYTKVYSVVDGYEGDKSKDPETKGMRVVNGWKNSGLPWTYSLDRDLMYFPE
ncbi:MAG TPA: rhodanese-like domain-containing protein [Gammaproteobacteria bacterium]|jgi:rhodanese-related sulfurtransferase|nr:rhodanese-like domain-containing protein [Gammaproteobacteria bacterium]